MSMAIGNYTGINNSYQSNTDKPNTGGINDYKSVQEYSNYLTGEYRCLTPGKDVIEISEEGMKACQETEEESEEVTSVGGSIGINVGKLARKLAAAQTKEQVQAVIEEIKQDLKECEAGKEQGMDVDEASVKAAKNVLGQANQRMSEVANREATPEEEMAFSLAALM